MSASQYQLDEADRHSVWFGLAVRERFNQRRRQFPDKPHDQIAALAAADLFLVFAASEGDVVRAVHEYLALEGAL